ncbi:MAG TPA: glycosyltransferase family 4 protein [Ramlibacter sp.]|nr:glycosyltransferase family 4 protein [Ramlibacter sp.]
MLAVASHPIQYHAPWFRALALDTGIDFSVLFIQQPDANAQGKGFGVAFEWDVPLLDGYRWHLAPGIRGKQGLHGFFAARIAHPLELLRQFEPDVLLLTGWHVWPLLQLLLAASWAGIPVIMRGESNALQRRSWPVRLFHKLLLGRCAAFLPIGRASREFYRGYGIAPSKLFDAPYFVDNQRFARGAAESQLRRDDLRRRWQLPADAVCFCYAGKLEPKKRILDLLEALKSAVGQSSRPLHLLVVGTGELMPQAKAAVAAHRLPVTFAGFLNQTEVPSAYAATDCLVLPSDYGETWGLVVNEAMACGRPVIVSDRVGCAMDLVTEGVTGAVFPFGVTEALAQRLVEFAEHPQRLQAMGERARARVVAGYSIERSVEGFLQAVRHVRGEA